MKILVSYRAIPQSPGWATGDSVVRAFRELGHEVFAYAKYYQENRWVENPTPTPSEFDLCLFMECNDGDPQYCSLKNIKSRKTACWLFDNSYYQDHCRGLIDYFNFDFKFIANPLIVDELKNSHYENVFHLPYACDLMLHARRMPCNKMRDIALIGSIRDDRVKLIDELNTKLPVKAELIGGLYRDQYIDALASSRIIINQNPSAGRGLLNMRFWETMAAGSFIMTERVDVELNGFKDLAEYNLYNTVDDIVHNCDMLLNVVQKDFKIFDHSYQQKWVMEYHSYKNRCQEILSKAFPNEFIYTNLCS